jgi:hypothetical protein
MRIAHLARTPELDGADDRPVGVDAALAARALEALVVEQLADDEPARLLGGHLARDCRHGGHEADHQRNATQHRTRPTDAAGLSPRLPCRSILPHHAARIVDKS